MSKRIKRRTFIKGAGVTALAASGGMLTDMLRAAEAPAIQTIKNPNAKIQIGIIGVGGRGSLTHFPYHNRHEAVVALCDAKYAKDEEILDRQMRQFKVLEHNTVNPEEMQTFIDYRELLDSMADKIDAVVVPTNDHSRAIICLDAMKAGKHVFAEKPLTKTIHESVVLGEAARKYKVATQMGNQGHPGTGMAAAFLQNQVLGPVREIYHFSNDAWGGAGDNLRIRQLEEVPEWLKLYSVPLMPEEGFTEYLGECNDPLSQIRKWNNWYSDRRWATGCIGAWACHTADVAFLGMNIDDAKTMKIECLKKEYGSKLYYNRINIYKWTVPARGDMPELEEYWYDGQIPNENVTGEDKKDPDKACRQNWPPKVSAMMREHGMNLHGIGTMYIGEKGIMLTGSHGAGGLQFVPNDLRKQLDLRIEPVFPRPKGGNIGGWYNAIRTGTPCHGGFEYSSKLNEHILTGLLAGHPSLETGTAVEYDRVRHRVTNIPELNIAVKPPFRKGYEMEV